MAHLTPCVRDGLVSRPGDSAAGRLVIGSQDWRTWLAAETTVAFAFEHAGLRLTARREHRDTGDYWYAYSKRGGRLEKAYLGRPEGITQQHLVSVASQLATRHARRSETTPVPAMPTSTTTSEVFRMPSPPAPPTRLIGREEVLASIQDLLVRREARLVTITGTAGVGKTRLALEVAAAADARLGCGVGFVDLTAVRDPALVMSTLAASLGIAESGTDSPLQHLIEALHGWRGVLILDNFEQVLAAATDIGLLLAGCPELTVVVTSRAALRLRWEHEVPLNGLDLPAERVAPLQAVQQSAAGGLFVERARAARPEFALTPDSAAAVAEICRRLDGLPLAIELAAARCVLFTPAAILKRLGQLGELPGAPRDLPERHRTLRAAIEWSFVLLDRAERTLLCRLAIFVGGWTLDAAEAVCASQSDALHNVTLSMASLVDTSLIQVETQSDGERRFRLLEAVREYALERLGCGGERDWMHERHAEYFLAWVNEVAPCLVGADQQQWMGRLEHELANIQAALRWSLDGAAVDRAVGAIGGLWRFWYMRGQLSEGQRWCDEAIGRDRNGGDGLARALSGAGNLAWARGDAERAAACHRRALRLFEELGDQSGAARAFGNLGLVAHAQGDYAEAERLQTQSLSLRRKLGENSNVAYTLNNLGLLARDRGEHARAGALFEECLAAFRQLGDTWGVAKALNNLAEVARDTRDLVQARRLHQESLTLKTQLGDRYGMAMSLGNLGKVALAQGDAQRAAELCNQSLTLMRELGLKKDLAEYVEAVAGVELTHGDARHGARLLGAAEALREGYGGDIPRVEEIEHERRLAAARRALGSKEAAKASSEGQRLTLDEVFEAVAQVGAAWVADPQWARLSPREREVVHLLARGWTNRDIADALVVSPRTADAHVSNVLGRLGLKSRTQVVSWSLEHRPETSRASATEGGMTCKCRTDAVRICSN